MSGNTGTVACLHCGRPIVQAKKRAGRHKRRCSPECDKAERLKANRRWRDAHREQPRFAFLCEPTVDERDSSNRSQAQTNDHEQHERK
ncbi:MAG: hypothetical protein HoeaKO_09770 [Hoeflea alexandrii]